MTTGETEQNDKYYIMRDEWMTFYFRKRDFKESDITAIVEEARWVMADVREYLGVEYSLDEAEGTVCYFDSTYRHPTLGKRSCCEALTKEIFCISIDSFIHEYTHMVCERTDDLVYRPDAVFLEGIAHYVDLHFHEEIASGECVYFEERAVITSNASEHETICTLLSESEMEYTQENYDKARVALLDKSPYMPMMDVNSDPFKYWFGLVLVDYCLTQLGDLETFMSVYCESLTAREVYGKPFGEILKDAIAYNTKQFFD